MSVNRQKIHEAISIITCTVELGIKNRQNKNKLGFKNQIVNDHFFM